MSFCVVHQVKEAVVVKVMKPSGLSDNKSLHIKAGGMQQVRGLEGHLQLHEETRLEVSELCVSIS